MCLLLLFSGVLSNVIHYSKRVEILLYSVSFGPHFSIISFLSFCRVAKKKNIISCFLISFNTYEVEFFFLIFFLIFWLFIYSTSNTQCLETWSCDCGYCVYGLLLCLHSLHHTNIFMPKIMQIKFESEQAEQVSFSQLCHSFYVSRSRLVASLSGGIRAGYFCLHKH